MAFSELRRIVLLAALVAVLMVLVTAGAAYGLSAATDQSGPVLFLAFAPGGLAEMSLIALTMGSAAAFVSTHHIARIILIVIAAPLLFPPRPRAAALAKLGGPWISPSRKSNRRSASLLRASPRTNSRPHAAAEWDRDCTFPVETLREAAVTGLRRHLCRAAMSAGRTSRASTPP